MLGMRFKPLALIWTLLYILAFYTALRWFVANSVILQMEERKVSKEQPLPPTEKPKAVTFPTSIAPAKPPAAKPLVQELPKPPEKPPVAPDLINKPAQRKPQNVIPTARPEQVQLGQNELDAQIKSTYSRASNFFISPRRVVHFDLKGAPMKPTYFQQIMPLLKQLGATSVLLEWEDMFPYKGKLQSAVNGYGYSEEDVKTILEAAKNENLEIIPLVQTFGHLEWILKLEQFAHLRDSPNYPQVICFGNEEAWNLLKDSIDQVATAHKPYGLPFFHIGADEAFQFGQCAESRALIAQEKSKERLMLWHIARTAQYIREKHETRVLAWHDMFQNSRREDLLSYKMPQLVEPVIWNYAENLDYYLPYSTWNNLQVFPYIWGASAFKGADGPSRYYSNPGHYVRNHQSWLGQIKQHWKQFEQFRGLILTGWSRYDHFAVLCELFPVGFPSLAMSLSMVSQGLPQPSSRTENFIKIMGCKMTPESELNRQCTFPGAKIYEDVQNLKMQKKRLNDGIFSEKDPGYEMHGWLSRMNLKEKYSSAWYLEKNLPKLSTEINAFQRLRDNLRTEMGKYFYPDAVDEFLYENVGDVLEKLTEMKRIGTEIKGKHTFPKRPFMIPS